MAERMNEESLSAHVKSLLQDAIDYSEELGELRNDTTKAYDGEKYGNEKAGRSQIVTREVRDAVEVAKPSLMRILYGAHRVLEFMPEEPNDRQNAQDATAYVEHVVNSVNNGYLETLSAVDDALVRKTGVFKVWYEESEMPKVSEHTGLTQTDIQILESDDEVTDIEVEQTGERAPRIVPPEGAMGPGGQPMRPPEPEPLFDATVTRVKTKGRIRFMAVPPEEFVISRKARNIETARLVGHYRNVTKSDLREMGYSEEDLENISGTEEDQEIEKEIRSVGLTEQETEEAGSGDDSQTEIAYAELWVHVDFDGDGIAELREICVAGSGCKILKNEIADEAPFATVSPFPTPHHAIGKALAELVEDVQKIKTMATRNIIDSLAKSIHPDVAAVEGQVNFDDLLNSEQGRILRQRQPGMIEYLSHPFSGDKVYPFLQYMDTLAEARTGMNEAAQGLNADALQSTATSAIDNATTAAMGRIEFIARTMIETGFKRLYKLIRNLAHKNVDRQVMVRLNRRFLEVDPRAWQADMDLDIVVPLSGASIEQRTQLLATMAAKQEQIIQTAGPDNPVAGPVEYRNTMAEIARLGGIVDVDRYFKDPEDPENQPEPGPEKPDPQMVIAQAEAERQRAEAIVKMQELELKAWQAMQEEDRKRDEMMANLMLDMQKAQQAGQQIDMQTIRNEIEREREGHNYTRGLIQDIQKARQQQQQMQMQQEQRREQLRQQQQGGQQSGPQNPQGAQ